MIKIPRKFDLVVGRGEGDTPLNAFDAALLDAGIGNLNLVRVSSILPQGAELVPGMWIEPGTLAPTAYGYITETTPGQTIAAAVGVGIADSKTFGVIMEFEGYCTKEEAEKKVRLMIEDGFKMRNLPLNDLLIRGIEHEVKEIGSVLAAVVMGY